MRIKNLILGDVNFQFKYGFYFVYAILTVLYVCLLQVIPVAFKETAASVMIFSDPAAMGLFFMGAIILLEKSQRVMESLAVSPLKVSEYIISKVLSLGFLSTIAGVLITVAAGGKDIVVTAAGTFLGSVIFSLAGLMIAAKISSLNQFLLATIPVELVIFIPAMAYMAGFSKRILLFHPGCIIISLLEGNRQELLLLLLMLCIWIGILYHFTYRIIKKMFQEAGGVKL
jgi:fluoroquinolone transport system permease protein